MSAYQFNQRTKPISCVPKIIGLLFVLSMILQIGWHSEHDKQEISIKRLPPAADITWVKLFFLDEHIVASRLLMLWLQSFDNQPGVSVAFKQLDYQRLIDWLALILQLDDKTTYPLLAASRLYAEVPDDVKSRQMIAFIRTEFLKKPADRWPWMAHAVYVAKHKIKDLDLALELAGEIRQYTRPDDAPYWARQLEIFILEQRGELESAMIMIGGLLDSGELKDPQQYQFLQQRLEEIKQRQED